MYQMTDTNPERSGFVFCTPHKEIMKRTIGAISLLVRDYDEAISF